MYFCIQKLSCPAFPLVIWGNGRCGTCSLFQPTDPLIMARKKSPNPDALLTCHIQAKVSQAVFKRLEQLMVNSDCQSMGELARRILSKERITYFIKDASMDAPMEELSRIRKELNAIGTNINQITHSFHNTDLANQKTLHALKVAEQYKKVGDKVDQLLAIVSQMAKKWLQK
jgi:hypothetical protein